MERSELELGVENASKAKQLPEPTGFKLLCALPEIETTYGDTGIIKADNVRRVEELTTAVLFVMAMGPDAYKDTSRFPSGPYCRVGDFVLTRPYSGTRVRIHGKEFRLINDDAVEAVVEDPRGLSRA